MSRVFVNYRRSDAGGHSQRLYEWLAAQFGDELFKDTESLVGGDDWPARLREEVASATVLLALIGPDWLDVVDGAGRRLDSEDDWVRREVATALAGGVTVIPVLLQDATLPPPDRLSPDIRELGRMAPLRVHSDRWAADVEALVRLIEQRGVSRAVRVIGWRTVGRLSVAARLVGHTAGVSDVAFAGDGAWVVTAGGAPSIGSLGRLRDGDDVGSLGDTTARLWRAADATAVHVLDGHGGWTVSVAVGPDGATLATGDSQTVRLWDLRRGAPFREVRDSAPSGTAVAVSPDGRLVAAGSTTGAVTIWRVADGSVAARRANHRAAVTRLRFSPDGAVLASSGHDGILRLWRPAGTASPTTLRTGSLLRGSPGAVRDVAFSPDGGAVAAACHDGRVRRWRVADGQPLPCDLAHPAGWATAVACSPDGTLLVSGSSQGGLRCWPVSGGPVQDVPTEGAPVNALAFSPDGGTLAVATWDGIASLWRVRPPEGRAV